MYKLKINLDLSLIGSQKSTWQGRQKAVLRFPLHPFEPFSTDSVESATEVPGLSLATWAIALWDMPNPIPLEISSLLKLITSIKTLYQVDLCNKKP